ncbi:MAG TPA: GAF domain-containing sensor histidine kinase [Fibrobacteria bacterium]|jgi:signal transduction histidine kinase|nr:GAF domain-containing sensor histidine kinase [Fibrobacteria bacterium]
MQRTLSPKTSRPGKAKVAPILPPALALTPIRGADLAEESPEVALDHFTRLAVQLTGATAGFMTLIEEESDSYRSVFRSVYGLDGNLRGRRVNDVSLDFFLRAFLTVDPKVIPDSEEPFLQALGARAFLGIPLLSADRQRVGSLCVLSSGPRGWSEQDAWVLEEIGHLILTEMRRRQAFAAARTALRSREVILATVAHDLRSPLSSVILGLELLADAPLSESQREQLQVTREVAESINAIVGDLMHMSELDSGKMALSPQYVDADTLVTDAVSVLRFAAERAGIALGARAEPGLPLVRVDYEKILRAFSNLVGNALKFTPRGGRITVAAEEMEGGVRFSVTDTGAGIPEANLGRIFEAFWRGEKREHPGLGLGLSIVKSIVTAHGGEIGVESKVGKGSTFWFRLPVEEPAAG